MKHGRYETFSNALKNISIYMYIQCYECIARTKMEFNITPYTYRKYPNTRNPVALEKNQVYVEIPNFYVFLSTLFILLVYTY